MRKREKEDIGINSVRCGNIVGIHEVIISTESQTITLKHEAHTRALFAEGAVAAARFICGKKAGLYNIKDMVRK
jgi:4-hydroxy-tetrahydrodipicolinate reductase